jgi:capsid protein
MVESMRPGPQFEPYIVVVARIVGAAVGMPLELVLLDFSRTSWASGRLAMDEARRTFRFWQKFSDVHICDPWYKRQITRGIATGELPADDRIYKKRTHWATWPYIQPQQAATANQIQIANRTKSISECIREQNRDPETVFNESADDFNTLRELGIPPQMLPQGVAEGASGSGGDEDNDK